MSDKHKENAYFSTFGAEVLKVNEFTEVNQDKKALNNSKKLTVLNNFKKYILSTLRYHIYTMNTIVQL